jgi:hypothetical protein
MRLRIRNFLLVTTMVVAATSVTAASHARAADITSFATRCGIHFCVDGKTFYVAGADSYDMFSYGGTGDTETQYIDKPRIDAHLAEMQSNGVTVVRTWMFGHQDANSHGFEPSKNVFNDQEFAEFDYILQSAKVHNIRVIPVLENFWGDFGGIDAVLGWEGLSQDEGFPQRAAFFNPSVCGGCLADYEGYLNHVLNWVNHYSGVTYRKDPTIFSWELMNEPRYQGQGEDTSGTTMRQWVDTTASYLKGIDPQHMVDTGQEGQSATTYGYGSDTGAPFVYVQQSPYIDFTSAHLYPNESWDNYTVARTETLIGQWVHDAHDVVGKPLFIGEWNTINVDRNSWWQQIYPYYTSSDVDGSAFWNYMDHDTGLGDANYDVYAGMPCLSAFNTYAQQMAAKSGATPPTEDPLDDLGHVYAHSAGLGFDVGNTQYFHGDTSRLYRTAAGAQYAVWHSGGMTTFTADTYFWPYDSMPAFQLYASPDDQTYTQVTPSTADIGGEWHEIVYTASSLPSGTNYVKVVFPTAVTNVWDPQIGNVIYG